MHALWSEFKPYPFQLTFCPSEYLSVAPWGLVNCMGMGIPMGFPTGFVKNTSILALISHLE